MDAIDNLAAYFSANLSELPLELIGSGASFAQRSVPYSAMGQSEGASQQKAGTKGGSKAPQRPKPPPPAHEPIDHLQLHQAHLH